MSLEAAKTTSQKEGIVEFISDFISVIEHGKANITIDCSIYERDAIHAATYGFTGDYHVLSKRSANDAVTVIFEAKNSNVGRDIEKDMRDFANAVIDHQVRLQLDRANGKIRDLIVAHAFSPLNLEEEAKCL